MRTDTIVRIASLTKPITCAGIMVLVDEGRTVVEASIIIEYLMLRHPGAVRLLPEQPAAALEGRQERAGQVLRGQDRVARPLGDGAAPLEQ